MEDRTFGAGIDVVEKKKNVRLPVWSYNLHAF
jgi:hypothetical protein